MRFDKPNCPECGEQVYSILETLYASALITESVEADGSFDYYGESKMHWDTQEPVEDADGITLQCHNGHEWQSRDLDNEPEAEAA